MGLTLQTAPATEPVTLTEAKAHCRGPESDDDTLLTSLIVVARQNAEQYTRRSFITQTWDLTFDHDWPVERVNGADQHRIWLPMPPTISVSSVTYLDSAGDSQTLAADQYKSAKTDTGEWVVDPAYGVTWPSVRDEIAAITVRFVAGYGNAEAVPAPIKHAMLLMIGHLYENREAVNVGNIVNEVPFAVDALLQPYRVFY